MRHAKRAYLTTEDVNNALRLRNVEVGERGGPAARLLLSTRAAPALTHSPAARKALPGSSSTYCWRLP